MSFLKDKAITQFLVFALLFCAGTITHARDSIVFTCVLKKTESEYKLLRDLYVQAFDKLDMDFSFLLTPGRRAVVAAASGQSDGNCARAYNYIERSGVPNLVRVDTSIASVDVQIWSRSSEISLPLGVAMFKPGTRVGYEGHSLWVEDYLDTHQGVVDTSVTSIDLGFKMLAAERFDYFIGFGYRGKNVLKRINIRRPIHNIGTLATVKLYPLLHRRHQHLAAPLASELKQLLEVRGDLVNKQGGLVLPLGK